MEGVAHVVAGGELEGELIGGVSGEEAAKVSAGGCGCKFVLEGRHHPAATGRATNGRGHKVKR